MPIAENGSGAGWVPEDGDLFQVVSHPEVWAYFQGRRFWVHDPEVAAALWGAGWPTLIAHVSADWLGLEQGRTIVTKDDWAAILRGEWQPPPPTPEDPNWEPAPDDPDEETWAYFGESVLATIVHEFGVLTSAIGRGLPNLYRRIDAYRLQLREIRKDWG